MTHTPAPWEIFAGTYCGFEKTDICTIFGVERMPTEDGLGVGYCTIIAKCDESERLERQTANARLIAAAPELLEALELTLSHVSAYYLSLEDDGEEQDCLMREVIEPAQKAIVKAKGESC